ncbi:Glycosyl hydrolases family 2, sugar binding domain [Actinacidiphila rubida]|uniref:Glycosyl hydrolases family 2, sugar binding domain n=2 Tax=Actinacidiphila rubida TaxID=310780 RepID=A0A1H8TL22_9ACTN|nr:glycoside hydrolase family 2 TIM barrel-domain containing protein [Actinacidiphila rubida]SEO91672.1 Glycosyl hydrolases family 2, sugar binding domain [Actinacidiphila rubida]
MGSTAQDGGHVSGDGKETGGAPGTGPVAEARHLRGAGADDGSYPRPGLRRPRWESLDGVWEFGFDDTGTGAYGGWAGAGEEPGHRLFDALFDREITVPFPPEAPASGIGDTTPHPVVWYRRRIPHQVLVPSGARPGDRSLIHFGAVDHRARVWLDGHLVAEHVGGQTPFTADVTEAMRPGADEHVLVVRAQDDPGDLAQPRGKQDWQPRPHAVWYERTTGIWQSVWSETVPAQHVADLAWIPDPARGATAELTLAAVPSAPLAVDIEVSLNGQVLAAGSTEVSTPRSSIDVVIPALRNGIDREELLWRPEHPVLLQARVTLRGPGVPGQGRDTAGGSASRPVVLDVVESYLGVRSAGVGGGAFLLNGRPYEVRSVLNQGYRPDTLLANSGTAELRREVELIKAMGFNAVRVHQKAEDPRFLYWADRLGLLVWGETGAAYEFGVEAVELLTREWLDLVRRDRSHPSVVTWVPINESWGAGEIPRDAAQRHYSLALAHLTRALDPTRPVLSNEGWEHTDSDILGVHDYTSDPETLTRRYGDRTAFEAVLEGPGPAGRVLAATDAQADRFRTGGVPLMVTEFGGLSLRADAGEFSYTRTSSDTQYAALLADLFGALRASPLVAGFCYTQFRDTAQETNGLLFEDGSPKLPLETIRRIVTGEKDGEAGAAEA